LTVTLKPQVDRPPLPSTAVQRTLVTPNGNDEPEGGEQLTLAPGQLSNTLGGGKFTAGEHCPGKAVTERLAGHVKVRGSTSFTVTGNEQVALMPPESVAIQVTVVVPIANLAPLGGAHTTLKIGQLSTARDVKKLTVAVHWPGSFA